MIQLTVAIGIIANSFVRYG